MEHRPTKPLAARPSATTPSGVLRQFRPAISEDWLPTDPRAGDATGTSRRTASSNLLKESSARASSSTQVVRGGKASATTSSRASRPKTTTEARRLSCPECLMHVEGVSGLEEHMRRRHDETALACPHCGEAIKHRTNLHRHIRIKHDERSGRSHCRKCGFACASTQDLERHKQRHTTCPFCNLVMESGTGLSKHMRNCRRRSSAVN